MPVHLSRGDRQLLLSGSGVFVLLLGAAMVLTRSPDDRTAIPSTFSSAPAGAKAAYLLLQSSGYRVERWQRPPDDLIDPAGTTLVLAEPDAPTPAERRAVQRFLEHGGRVIATGPIGLEFLSNDAPPTAVGDVPWQRFAASSPSDVTRAAPAVTLAPQLTWPAGTPALPLYGPARAPVVVHLTTGSGTAFWWAAATPLTNAGLREPGNLEFFLASIGHADRRRVLFDEYFHGARESVAVALLHSPVKWIAAELGIFAMAIVFTYARRHGPIIRPASETRLSPVEFVRTLGSLYGRAGAAPVAVEVASRRFRGRLTARLGLSRDAPVDVLERAVTERWHVDGAALAATLHACEAAEDDARLDARRALPLVQALSDQARALGLFAVSSREHR